MSNNLFLMLVIAFVIIVLAIAGLAVAWLITGKSKVTPGCCGKDGSKKQDDNEDGKNACCNKNPSDDDQKKT